MSEATTVSINGKTRAALGKKGNKRARAEGWLPGIIYGHKQDPLAVLLPAKELTQALRHGAHLLTVNFDGGSEQVFVKDVQFDAMGSELLHVDLTRVDLNERVTATVPIVLRGTPKGAAEGGVLEQILTEIDIECVVTQIPESLRVSVADLGIGDALHVSDLPLAEGMEPTVEAETAIAVVRELGEEPEEEGAAAEAEAGPMEPEVIGRDDEEQEEEE
jgi:large subunit ribosomal protein L25